MPLPRTALYGGLLVLLLARGTTQLDDSPRLTVILKARGFTAPLGKGSVRSPVPGDEGIQGNPRFEIPG